MAVIKALNSKAQVKQSTAADVLNPPAISNRVIAFYDAIVGSALQVSSGAATHTQLSGVNGALAAVGSGGIILILKGTYTETVSISNTVKIVGQGHSSVLTGNVTISANYCDLDSWKVSGNITLSGNNNFLKLWQNSTGTFSDSGLANDNRISQE